MSANDVKVGRVIKFPGGDAVQTVFLSGTRVTLTASAVSTAETALPSGARVIAIRAVEAVWIRFGNTGVGAAAADNNSVLFPAGESVIPVPLGTDNVPFTHVRVLVVGSSDTVVQFESVSHVSTA